MVYGTEVVASADEAETLVIKVRDSGRGIRKTDLTKIFDPFFTTKEKGMGLGLAVVHGIIKEHSGTIHVESTLDQGSRFALRFSQAIIHSARFKDLNEKLPDS